MLSYAFQALNEDKYLDVATEEFEYAADLLAAILSKGIANQIRRGLGREYLVESDALSSAKGKISISDSIKEHSILKRQLVCTYDVFSENIYMNKILKTTALLLIKSVEVDISRKKALKKVMLYFQNVEELDPRMIRWSAVKYNRNNATYRMLINICYLVIQGLLLKEEDGNHKLSKYIDDQNMYALYERFILEYYRKHYPQFKASAAHIDWNVDDGFVELLPRMKSDITLEFQGKTIIIDAKYYSRMLQYNQMFQSKTMHSNNLYQIFTYVKNKDVNATGNVSGVLLYARTDEEIAPNHDYMMSGNKISVKSLDLSDEFLGIAEQLDRIAEPLVKMINI